jgi:hypothetical protein
MMRLIQSIKDEIKTKTSPSLDSLKDKSIVRKTQMRKWQIRKMIHGHFPSTLDF